jgi:tetratricopeptide (TPR) repeat protein
MSIITNEPYIWIESTSWELGFFGLPQRIPWPADVDPKKASEDPFDHVELVRAIEMLGPDAGDPWTPFRLASVNFDELAECLEDQEFPRAAELLDEVERLHPGTAFVAFHRGIVARQDGRFEEAIGHYQAAAQKTPNLGVIWLHLGTLLAQEERRDEAIAALQQAVRCNPQDTNALEALAALRAAVKLLRDPKDPKSAIYVPVAQFRQMSIQQLQQLRDNAAGLREFADFQLRNGFAPELGVQALERARELTPGDPATLAALTNAYRVTGQHDQARSLAIALTESHGTHPQAWLNLAHTCNAAGDRDGERAALEKMLEVDPNAQPALVLLFDLNTGATPEKEARLAAFGEEKKAPFPLLLASSSARDRGDLDAAVRHALRAYELAPEREEVLLHLCAMLGDAKDQSRLASHIEPAVQSGKYSPRLAWNYAQALKALGRTNEAAQTLINAASAEGAPQDFQHMVGTTIDLWVGRLAQGEIPLALSKANTLARPVVLSVDGEDGAVVLQAGQPVPLEGRFPWRVRLDGNGETRIALQQGQTGSPIEPTLLGSFAVKVPPLTGGAHTIQCLLGTGPEGRLLFKAMQGNKELLVRWIAPIQI